MEKALSDTSTIPLRNSASFSRSLLAPFRSKFPPPVISCASGLSLRGAQCKRAAERGEQRGAETRLKKRMTNSMDRPIDDCSLQSGLVALRLPPPLSLALPCIAPLPPGAEQRSLIEHLPWECVGAREGQRQGENEKGENSP